MTRTLRVLAPLAWLYGGVIRLRNRRFERTAGAVQTVDVPVVSVGNITVGGTGKTPLVIEIVRRLQALGRQPAVLTRGYKAAPGQSADEVREYAAAVAGLDVVVDPDRVAGARRAVRELGADCLVLDDGFQHRRLGRDLDVVLIDALAPFGGGYLLPAGRLREPLASLARADVLVITRANQASADEVQRIEETLRKHAPEVPVVRAEVVPDALVGLHGAAAPLTTLRGQRVVAAAGIGNPQTFLRLVESLGATRVAGHTCDDHHHYGPADVRLLERAVRANKANCVVTTRKDWVKLRAYWSDAAPPLWRLDIRARLPEQSVLDQRLRELVEAGR